MRLFNKRALSIATYNFIYLAIAYILVAMVVVVSVDILLRRNALFEARAKADLLLNHNLAIHTYHSHQLKPHLFARIDPESSFDPVLMSSTFAVRSIDGYFRQLAGDSYYYKECAIDARNPFNEADAIETGYLARLNADPATPPFAQIRSIDGNRCFVYMKKGETIDEMCLRCHGDAADAPPELIKQYGAVNSFNRRAGEIVSAVSIRIPVAEAYERASMLTGSLSMGFIVILGLLFVVKVHLSRVFITEPLRDVSESALRISRDPGHVGGHIEVGRGRELVTLADAFNTMSDGLADYHDNLEDKVAAQTRELRESTEKLKRALDEIKTLRGIIPICSYCKKIRTDEGSWQQMERYISEHSDARFSHGVCPDCMEKLEYGDEDDPGT